MGALSCSDSRVPTNIVTDQGFADALVIRVAGAALDTAALASLRYALHHLRVKVLIAVGHGFSGAVRTAHLQMETLAKDMPTQL